MVEKNIGISQQTLVSNASYQMTTQAAKLPQYVATIAATLGALAMGFVLAWTSSADHKKLATEYEMTITKEQYSWIGSLINLGAATICIPIGILADKIGRKTSMLLLVVPFTIGWLWIYYAQSVTMFLIGRFVTGLAGGAFCVTAPMYTAEIGETSIRGTLGSYFQFMLVIGILLAYVLAPIVSIHQISLISLVIPIIFFAVFFFMPESPIYYLKKGKDDAARDSLKRLRGPNYNVEPELQNHRESMLEAERNKVPFLQAMQSKAAKKGMIIAFGLMFFQQLSGVNSIIFYSSEIFKKASDQIEASTATIIVGVIQVLAVFISTLIIDKAGRRILLISSIISMMITTFVMGFYFYFRAKDVTSVENIGWVPLTCVCIYIFMFSIGFGPIPWMMMGELFSNSVKGIASSSSCLFNWLMAFLVTKYFKTLEDSAGTHVCFWIFSLICLLGTIFCLFVIPETKGKTLEEIQYDLGDQRPTPSGRSKV